MLAERIRELRVAKGMSQVDLAKKVNISKQSVSNWENDNIQPSIEMLERLANVFCVSTDYMLGRDDRRYIEVQGLTPAQLAHIQQIIDDIRR